MSDEDVVFNPLIGIILGILVLAAVAIVLFIFFKNQIIGFFNSFAGNGSKFFLSLIRS